jgi:D-sedoheptulose 7-phosphate isomerase
MSSVDPRAFARQYAADVSRILATLDVDAVAAGLALLEAAHAASKQVFLVGNGGSAATASHWANDLTWGLVRAGIRPLRAIALTDNVPVITAIANDSSYDEVFSRQLDALATPGDLLIAISGSGNSPNVLRAVELAREKGLKTLGILGMKGGKVGPLVDVRVVVDASDYGPIEDLHMVLDHLALAYLRLKLKT